MGFHIPSRIDSAYFPGSGYRQGRKTQAKVFATPDKVRPPYLTRETISVRSGPGPVCENLRLSLPSPEKTWTGEGGGINSGGDIEAHPCLMRFLTNLARLCASKSANGPRKNSFRPDSPSRQPSTGRLSHPPHHTGHGPFRTRPPTSVKSLSCLTDIGCE